LANSHRYRCTAVNTRRWGRRSTEPPKCECRNRPQLDIESVLKDEGNLSMPTSSRHFSGVTAASDRGRRIPRRIRRGHRSRFLYTVSLPFDPKVWIQASSDVVTSHTPTHEAPLRVVSSIVGSSIVSRRRSTSSVEARGARRMVIATNLDANLTLCHGLMMVC